MTQHPELLIIERTDENCFRNVTLYFHGANKLAEITYSIKNKHPLHSGSDQVHTKYVIRVSWVQSKSITDEPVTDDEVVIVFVPEFALKTKKKKQN